MEENSLKPDKSILFVYPEDLKDPKFALNIVKNALKRDEYSQDYPILLVLKGVLEEITWNEAAQRLLLKIVNKSVTEEEIISSPRNLRSF